MLEIRAYYHDILRYTTVGDWDKVHELRNNGFNVQVKDAAGQEFGLGGLRSTASLAAKENGDAIVRHEAVIGFHEPAQVEPDDKQNTLLGFY